MKFGMWIYLWVFLVAGVCTATPLKPLIISQNIGPVIDSEENSVYKIVGPLPGFSAASLYQKNNATYILRIVYNRSYGAGILVVELDQIEYFALQSSLLQRTEQQTLPDDLTYIISVDTSDAQNAGGNYKIELNDGSVIYGALRQAKTDTLQVLTFGGLDFLIPEHHIIKFTPMGADAGEKPFIRVDPNTSRLLFAPTGRALKKGTGYFADYFIFFPTVAFGITDHISLSGGMSLLPGADSQLLYIAPKVSFNLTSNITAGTGILYLAIPEEEDDLGLGYGVVTWGDQLQGFTLGGGFQLNPNSDNDFVWVLGAEKQISNSVKLLSENWFITGADNEAMISGAIRFFGERLAVDLALLTTFDALDEGGFPFLPWVDFSYFFEK